MDVTLSDNEKKVLNTVRKKGIISINDIVESGNLSTATGSRLINKLIADKFLIETEISPPSNSGKGRPQRHVKWHGKDHYMIGIDVGTTHIRGAIYNLNIDCIKEIEFETIPGSSIELLFQKINTLIDRLYDTDLIEKKKILGIGMAFAGLINKNSRIIKFSPAFSWHDIDVSKYIINNTQLPIYYDNVTRLMALSENYFGFGKEYDNFIFINIGFGIGACAVIDNNLFVGPNGYAGEFGHVIAEPNSNMQCSCGQHGCLTTTSSGEFILKRAIDLIHSGQESILSNIEIKNISTKSIFTAAENGDQLCNSVINQAINHLAIKISDLKKMFDPQAVIIGGGISQNGEFFFSKLRNKVNSINMKYDEKTVPIYPRTYLGKAASIGAAIMVAQKELNL